MELTDPNTAVADNVSGTRFYTFGGATVAVRTTQGLSLLLGDEQGSAQIMMPLHTDSNGALLPATQADADATERTAYAPYGARRGEDLEAINRGWLGQVEDTGTGLTYLNARYYDPAIGRFLSPDPLMNPGDPRTLDPYRYADNNPVVYTDETGLCNGCTLDEMKAVYGGGPSVYGPGPKKAPPTVVFPRPRWSGYGPTPKPMPGFPPDPTEQAEWIAQSNANAAAYRQEQINGMSSLDILDQFIGADAQSSARPRWWGMKVSFIPDLGGNLTFGDDSRYVDALRKNGHHQMIVGGALEDFAPGYGLTVGDSVPFNWVEGSDLAGPMIDASLGIWGDADSPALAEAILGSYSGAATVLAIDPKRNATLVQVTVHNDMSLASVIRIPGQYSPNRDAWINGANNFPRFQTVQMTITYTEWHYGVD